MNFQIGQKVVCVDVRDFHPEIIGHRNSNYLIKGKTYSVLDVRYCTKCGDQSIYVGFTSNPAPTICNKCRNETPNNSLLWHTSRRFVPLEEYEASEKMVEELLEPAKEKI